ncbi:unnamed protein product [Calypogeia fissa]
MDDNREVSHLTMRGKMMTKVMNWAGLCKSQLSENGLACGGQGKNQQPGEDLVLDHIILDLTGDSVPLDQIADASVQKAFKRKKRLLRHSNTVLFSRLGIMALVAVMLVVTTILTWYFTSTYGARSVRSLATVLRQQLLRTSTQAMVSILGEVYNGTLVLCSLHQQVYFANSNKSWDAVEPKLRKVNRGVFNAQPQYSSVAFVATDGRLTDFSRKGQIEYFIFVNESSSNPVWYIQNVSGYVNESAAPPPTVRLPPYPVSAGNVLKMEPLKQVWWTIAPNSLGEAVVSPAVPLNDLVTNKSLGVATITSTFQYLNSYLATVDLLGGFLYFQWNNGTDSSSIVAFSYNDTSDILVSPYNSANPVVRAAASYLGSRYGDGLLFLGESHNEDVSLAGQKYYIDTIRLTQTPYDALNLTAVMILPRSSIMGRIDKRNHTVIHVIVGTAVGVLVLGCCFICFLTSKMSTEMQLRAELIRLLVGKHRAEQSSNYKSQFLANMSHELRTPIAGIIGLLDLLSCDSLTSDQEYSVSQIRRCATGLLALVNNVLDISKVEAGKMELETAPFSVADELESLVDMFAAQSVGSKIDLVLDLSENIPALVKGDATRIRQIFSNLLSNSLKFTTHGYVLVRGWVDQSLLEPTGKRDDFSVNLLSGRERVSGPLLMSAENQLALVFEVDDSGCGILPELHETVFDSFVQGDSSTTRTHGGSGLGLYIVRSLVELMGGEVAVVPTEGPGCVMRFHIIVERSSDPIPTGHRASAEGSAFGFAHGRRSSAEGQAFGFGHGRRSSAEGQALSFVHGHRSSAEGESLGSPSEQEGLDSLLGSPFNVYEPYRMSLPEGLDKTQVLVAMQIGVARNVAVNWLERNGLKVTCVDAWTEIIPTLERMARIINPELKSINAVGNDDPGGGGRMGSHSFPPGVRSPESLSQTSENLLESGNFPPVLALVDVTLLPNMKIDLDRNYVDPGNLSRSEVEKLPCHMQDMLDSMLRIHFQRSVAVSWVVGPNCGAKWKQALQGDGCFLVLNKPLHGSRLRRLLSFVARTGKLEQHHWEVHTSLFGSPLSLRPSTTAGTPFSEVKVLESSISPDPRGLSEPSSDMPSHRTSNARKSSDDELMYQLPERLLKDTGGPSVDALQNSSKIHAVGESSFGHQIAEIIPKGNADSNSSSPEIPKKSQSDDQGTLYMASSIFDRAISTNPPSSGLQRFQKVLPVDIPYGTSTPESPLSGLSTPEVSGQSTPEIPFITGVNNNSKGHGAVPDGGQVMRKNGVETRDLEEDWIVRKQKLSPKNDNGGPSSTEKPAARPDRSSGENSPASAFVHKALSGMHILLVEDTAVLQRLVSMTLKKLGANVTVVGDGLQAVAAVAETVEATRDASATRLSNISQFDLILMDCAMPVMDGYNATKAIREAEENTARHIPIVALTAHALASDEERCLSVGMDAYLTKPINCKLMVTTIRRLISQGRTRHGQ